MDATHLQALVKHLEFAPVECDGMSRLVATVLSQQGIPFQGMVGSIVPKDTNYRIPHFWVQVGDLVIDYRAQMWLGDASDVPHGVVRAEDYPGIYEGEPFHLEALPESLFQIMKMPFPTELRNSITDNDGPGR